MWGKLWGGITGHDLPSLTIVAATLMFCIVILYGLFWLVKQRGMNSIILRVLGSLWVAGIMTFSFYLGMIGIIHSKFVIFG
jgi:hypothetical protein